MSFQAVTWAIAQQTGSPSAKAALWSIANYANDLCCAWPRQEVIAADSEQSPDSVQRRIADLIDKGLIRRLKLRRFGRRTHDFLILAPSPLFGAPLDEIRPHLPASCDLMTEIAAEADAAADCGSVAGADVAVESANPDADAAADCGSVAFLSQPQSAVHAAATVRQPIEPVKNLKKDSIPQSPLSPQTESGQESGEGQQGQQGQDRDTESDTDTDPDAEAAEPPDDRVPFHRFAVSYPIPILKPAACRALWQALDDAERERACEGARGYGRFCDAQKRRVMDAHKFLRDRLWPQFLTAAAGPAWQTVEATGAAGRAWIALNLAAGRAVREDLRLGEAGQVTLPAQLSPQALALAEAPDELWSWWVVAPGTPEAAAWRAFLLEALGWVAAPGERRVWSHDGGGRRSVALNGYRVPWRWPPRKDGTRSDTAPPGAGLTAGPSDADVDDFLAIEGAHAGAR